MKNKREFTVYLISGGITTAVNYFLYAALLALNLPLLAANSAAWAGAVLTAYSLNRRFVFRSKEPVAGELAAFASLLRYAVDGILSFSSAPAALSGITGAALIIIAAAAAVFFLLTGSGLTGIPLLVCLVLLLSGIQMFFISIVGQYAAKDYMESKHRPIYIVKKRRGFP